VNRVGDIGMALGTMLTFVTFGTVAFAGVSAAAGEASQTTMTLLGLLFLLAACGKSAQVPLQSWLLDAMEGPTPVSALIHAATMVTAGVYLVVRSSFIYDYTEAAQTAVVVVGAVTLLWGAVIGCAKDDIKKALAGSTNEPDRLHDAGRRPRPSPATRSRSSTCSRTASSRPTCSSVPARSCTHGRRRGHAHYGALSEIGPGHRSLTVPWATSRSSGFPGSPGFWSKDKIIETALHAETLVGPGRNGRRRRHAFYMTG
jgi:NADH-quinone oxidoreductase subunit L